MNTIKFFLALILSALVQAGFAQTWIQTGAPTNQWSSVACSADGTRIIASTAISNSVERPIYISTNSGGSWMKTSAPDSGWTSVASSSDGTVLVAASSFLSSGAIYSSTNSGGNWTSNDVPIMRWVSVACSANGNILAAASTNNGRIYTSTNLGVTWISNDVPNRVWRSIACSADGTRLIAASKEVNGVIYTSTNSGTTWTSNNAPQNAWQAVACSSDGMNLVAVGRGNNNTFPIVPRCIYVSTNSGETWVQTVTPFLNWISVVPRGESEFIAASSEGWVFISTDSGMNWKANGGFYQNCSAIAASRDGSKLVATSDNGWRLGGGIFTSIVPSPPPLNLAVSGQTIVISWPWPSVDFVLQKNSDLSTPNWTVVTNAPAVVNRVILSPTGDSEFYRLEPR